MISTSNAWKTHVANSSVFDIKATMTGGSTVNLTNADFMQGSVSFTDSMSGMNEIKLGAVVTNSFSATLNNYDGRFDNWTWTEIEVWFGVNGEWIHRGKFIIDRPSSVGATVKIECYDYMDKLNKYFNGLIVTTYPVTYKALVQAICTACGVTFGTWSSSIPNTNVTALVASAFDESTTCRQVVGWLLETVGGYARINPVNNKLDCLVWNRNQWSTGAYALEKVKNQTIFIDDVEVTGIRAYVYNNTTDTAVYGSAGTSGYVLNIKDNPFVNDNNKGTVASAVWANVQGLKVRPFSSSMFGDPSIEAGDTIILHDLHTDTYHISIITSLTFNLGGDMRVSCDVNSPDEQALQLADPQTASVKLANEYTDTAIENYDPATDLNQETVYNKLTNNGSAQGLFLDTNTGDLYVNASWLSAGTITADVRLDINTDSATRDAIKLNWTDQYNDSYSFLASPSSIQLIQNNKKNFVLDNNLSVPIFTIRDNTNTSMVSLNGLGKGVFQSTVTATQFITSSSVDVKKYIKPMNDSALEKIKSADIMSYNLKSEEKGARKHIGLVIGDKYNTPSEVVVDEEETVGVDLYSMITMAWKAIQEQAEQIESLEKRVAELESKKENAK